MELITKVVIMKSFVEFDSVNLGIELARVNFRLKRNFQTIILMYPI